MPDLAIATMEEVDVRAQLVARRSQVVRRLIDRGMTAGTLTQLLPDWEPFVAAAVTRPEPAHR